MPKPEHVAALALDAELELLTRGPLGHPGTGEDHRLLEREPQRGAPRDDRVGVDEDPRLGTHRQHDRWPDAGDRHPPGAVQDHVPHAWVLMAIGACSRATDHWIEGSKARTELPLSVSPSPSRYSRCTSRDESARNRSPRPDARINSMPSLVVRLAWGWTTRKSLLT